MSRCSLIVAAMAALVAVQPLMAEEKWWPSRWGPDDEAGNTNYMTPAKTLAATALIKQGIVVKLGHDYHADMPIPVGRVFALRIPGAPSSQVLGSNQVIYNDEYLTAEIGQVGTQMDGFGHMGLALGDAADRTKMTFYNGVTAQQMMTPRGLIKHGVEKLKPLFTRGILIDLEGGLGDPLAAGYEVTVADILQTLAWQGMSADDIQPGDALLLHTGWGRLWMVDNQQYASGEPGPGQAAANWLAARQPVLVGMDNWSIDVMPNPNDPDIAVPAHIELLVKNGILLHENLKLAELATRKQYRFAYIFTPLPIRGATGSPGSPIAVY